MVPCAQAQVDWREEGDHSHDPFTCFATSMDLAMVGLAQDISVENDHSAPHDLNPSDRPRLAGSNSILADQSVRCRTPAGQVFLADVGFLPPR